MLVKEFLNQIEAYGDKPLLFEYRSGSVVQGGYHVTEIKNTTFETIDCGNSLHSWQEVVVQIWVPDEARPEDAMMPASKFLKIWDVVDRRLHLFRDAEIRIEYGDSSFITSNYHVDGFRDTEDGLIIEMAPPRTMCKPREILVPFADEAVVAAAGTQAGDPIRLEMVSPLPMAASASDNSCCAPAPAQASASSGCCAPASSQKATASCC